MPSSTSSSPLQAVEMAREGFGEDDPHMASACNNLAEFYRIRRQYDAAEPLYRQVWLLGQGGPPLFWGCWPNGGRAAAPAAPAPAAPTDPAVAPLLVQ